jgi:two-component system, chemotaxis family, protein-glutamate methylesterase/glutaminase
MDYELIVIGASWGGLQAVGQVLADAGDDLPATIVVQHRDPSGSDGLASLLQERTRLELRDAEDKDELAPGTVYLAPLDYHLLVESGGTLALSTEDRVHFARPSIDVLFESAAHAYRDRCVGIVLTGANEDGAAGLKRIKELGGVAIVQDPKTSTRSEMPAAALAATNADVVLPLEEIGKFLRGLVLETRVRT